MFADLRKKAGEEPAAPAQPKPADETPPAAPAAEPQAKAPAQPVAEPGKEGVKEKVNPWKLVDEHKAARAKVELELAELRKQVGDPGKFQEAQEKMAAIEKRAKELEDHIKFVDYSKSQEFTDKYQKPYEDAWRRWMGDLGELRIHDAATGSERGMEAQDLLELVNLPLQKARDRAEEVFGPFADDVMSARKEIRSLFDAQERALGDARKNASSMMEARQKEMQAQSEALSKEITEIWKSSNSQVLEDATYGKYFKPTEGDDEGNKRLAKGYEMADEAFSVSPLDPKLTPEQRAKIVRLHSAVRNRSAAFGRLTHLNQQLESKIAELTAELNRYRSAEPGAGAPKPSEPAPGTQTSAKDSVFGALHKLAR